MTTWIFRVAAVCIFFCRAAMPLGAQDLRILCETGGRSLTLGGVDKNGKVLVLDGDKAVPAPKDAVWRVEGDVRSQREWFAWAPPYEIKRYEDQGLVKNPGAFFEAKVRFDAVPYKTEWKAATRVPLRSRWPRAGLSTGVLVSCWVKDGLITAVNVTGSSHFEIGVWSGGFPLSAELARGQPAVLVWSDGRIERPEPLFADPAVEAAALAALCEDDASAVGSLLEKQPQLARQVSKAGRLFLNIVAEAGSVRVVKALIAADAKLAKALPKDKRTPLQDAAAKGREEVITALLMAKFDKNADATDTTAMIEAATAGHTGSVKLLVDAGADTRLETSDYRSAFTQAADRGYVDIVEMLFPMLPSGFRNTDDNQAVLRTQASRGHTAMVRWMLRKKVSPNSTQAGFSALGLAALAGHRDTLDALLEGKADVKWVEPKSGFTALMLAAGMAHTDCVEALLNAGADAKALNSVKSNALHIAALADAGRIIELLLARGVDLHARGNHGFSALEVALIGQNPKAVEALERAGAKIDLKSKYADDSLEAALTMDRDELIARAVADGWPVNTRLKGGWPVIRVAKFLGAEKCAALLAKAGADESSDGPYPIARSKDLDAAPKLIEVAIPNDPRPAEEVFDEQTVVVEAMVAADGRILFPKIIETSEKRLGMAVVDVVSAWRLTPITRGGAPVAAKMRIPVQFPASNVRALNLRDLDEMPKARTQVVPEYPHISRIAGREARAIIQFTVGTDGIVKDIRVIEHTGMEFAEAAVAAVKKWTYTPGKVAGKPVAVRMQIPIIFGLEGH